MPRYSSTRATCMSRPTILTTRALDRHITHCFFPFDIVPFSVACQSFNKLCTGSLSSFLAQEP
jgi:hypothetical protein